MKIIIAHIAPQPSSYYTNLCLKKEFALVHFPLGLGIIAAVLKRVKRQFKVYDNHVDGTTEEFLQTVGSDKPDVILLSGLLGDCTYPFIKDITRQIKECSRPTTIIIGGPMATTIPKLLISRTSIDYVVEGEGERTIVELLDALEKKLDFSLVKGIYFRDLSDRVVFTGQRQRIENLDESPFPSYDSFSMAPYINDLKRTGRSWAMCTSRGCYNHCHFCKITFSQKVTSYSCQAVVEHMAYVSEKYGFDRFSFVDDNFLNNPRQVDEFVEVLNGNPRKFKWRFQGRADRTSPEMVKKMISAGLFNINFGIESGNQEMLNRYGKNLDIKKAFANLESIKDMIEVHATFIVGGPGEDWNTIKETEQFIRRLKLKNTKVSILTLFPGTVFYDAAVKNGLIKDEEEYCVNLGPAFDRPYVNISNLSDEELLKARDVLLNTAAEFGTYA